VGIKKMENSMNNKYILPEGVRKLCAECNMGRGNSILDLQGDKK